MTISDGLLEWSSRWRLSAGLVICRQCQAQQSEMHQAQPFEHGVGCLNQRFGLKPWAELTGLVPLKG